MIPQSNERPRCTYIVQDARYRGGERECGRMVRVVDVEINGVPCTVCAPACPRHQAESRQDPAFTDAWADYDEAKQAVSDAQDAEWRADRERHMAERRADDAYWRQQVEATARHPYGGVSRVQFFDTYRAIVNVAIPPLDLAPSSLFSEAEIQRRMDVQRVLASQLGRLSKVPTTHTQLPAGVLRFRPRRALKA